MPSISARANLLRFTIHDRSQRVRMKQACLPLASAVALVNADSALTSVLRSIDAFAARPLLPLAGPFPRCRPPARVGRVVIVVGSRWPSQRRLARRWAPWPAAGKKARPIGKPGKMAGIPIDGRAVGRRTVKLTGPLLSPHRL
jgi:hypothetical protein